jgi:very-short-patch-repair endonuclease
VSRGTYVRHDLELTTTVWLRAARLVLPQVEYEGWQHERDPRQRQHDRERRELLEGAGWRVIIVTSADLEDKRAVVRRIHTALKARGYEGREPLFDAMWDKFFA